MHISDNCVMFVRIHGLGFVFNKYYKKVNFVPLEALVLY